MFDYAEFVDLSIIHEVQWEPAKASLMEFMLTDIFQQTLNYFIGEMWQPNEAFFMANRRFLMPWY